MKMKSITLVSILFGYALALGQTQCHDLLVLTPEATTQSQKSHLDIVAFFESLRSKGLIINQKSEGLHLANTACGPVCVINMVQTILTLKGQEPLKDPVAQTNELSKLRVFQPENGSTFEELQAMIQKLSSQYRPLQLTTSAVYLDRGKVYSDFSVPRAPQILPSDISSYRPQNNLEHFDILAFTPLSPDGSLSPQGHAILALGVDQATGFLLIMDPNIGETALVSLHEISVLGRKSIFIQYEKSLGGSPYWNSYSKYGKLVITGLISVKSTVP